MERDEIEIGTQLRPTIIEKLGEECRSHRYYRDDFEKDILAFDKLFNDVLKFDKIEQKFSKLLIDGWQHDFIITYIVALCMQEIQNILKKSKKNLKNLKEKLKEIKKIIIFVGAGVSFEADIGRNITNIALGQTFSEEFSNEEIEKEIQEHRGKKFWEILRSNNKKRFIFQKNFTDIVNEKEPVESHYYLACLLQRGILDHLVCFNWDNFIERAYKCLYNLPPSIVYLDQRGGNERFWKPHGCVDYSSTDNWIFPPEVNVNSYFEENCRQRIRSQKPMLVLSFGFSGGDQFTKDYLKDLVGFNPVYDIRPDIKKERDLGESIYMSSSRVLKEIIAEQYPVILAFLESKDIPQSTLG